MVFLTNYLISLISGMNTARYLHDILYEYFNSATFRDMNFYCFLMIIVMVLLTFFISDPSKLKVSRFLLCLFTYLLDVILLFGVYMRFRSILRLEYLKAGQSL